MQRYNFFLRTQNKITHSRAISSSNSKCQCSLCRSVPGGSPLRLRQALFFGISPCIVRAEARGQRQSTAGAVLLLRGACAFWRCFFAGRRGVLWWEIGVNGGFLEIKCIKRGKNLCISKKNRYFALRFVAHP